ncbi:CPBP family intramembrane glutamic endopeptidase [Pedobacter sp. SYP-B3415]|uniref:CPBP family intramembrane glutamic endopeptidase n=1 Tax=Pedobacter sp. SYP-B3415 TaxID=2496641 RepID=UPI00101D0753|nr:type II CAAX endopeptidase family protein [Pedobacter sp. SYP-B3415]
MVKFVLLRAHPLIAVSLYLILFTACLYTAGLLRSKFPQAFADLAFGIPGCLGAAGVFYLFQKIGQPTRPKVNLSWSRQTLPKFGLGILIGGIAFLMVLAPLLLFTPLSIQRGRHIQDFDVLLALLPVLPLALMEEIGFRSYALFKLREHYGIWISQITMASVFGAFHLLYGWSLQVAFMGPFVWAFMLALAALRSGGVAVPTGIHFALNIFQQLCGLKGNTPAAVWKVDFPAGSTKAPIVHAGALGTGMHMLLLLLFLLLTFFYGKQEHRRQSASGSRD